MPHPDRGEAAEPAGTAELLLARAAAEPEPSPRPLELAAEPPPPPRPRVVAPADDRRVEVALPSSPFPTPGGRPPDAEGTADTERAGRSESRVVGEDELLREHVAPALVARGAVGVRAAERLSARGLEAVEVPAAGDVHVHIGSVELRQPDAPAPPPPTPAGHTREPPDHADYLQRQERRWS